MHFDSPISFQLAAILLALLSSCYGKEYYWTVKVMPGMRECFYESVESGIEVEAEFQMLSGGSNDIGFEVTSPGGQRLYVESNRDAGSHEFKTDLAGDYEFCLNNQMSSWAEKLVFLELAFDRDDWTPPPDVGEKTLEMSSSLDSVKHQLAQVRSIQEYLRSREARHRHTAESNEARVLYWSLAECGFILTVGIVQVLLLKKLFDDGGQVSA